MTSPVAHRKTRTNAPAYPVSVLVAPIPGVGTSGTLKIGGVRVVSVKKDDKITVRNTDGTVWVYFSNVDIQHTDLLAPSMDVAVSPLIQAVHSTSSTVTVSGKKHVRKYGRTVIGDFAPNSATGDPDGTTYFSGVGAFPHLRPWPWSSDIHGIPYDQANLLALSFYNTRSLVGPTLESNPVYDASGTLTSNDYAYGAYPRTDEERALIPVPKTIPVDYVRLLERQVFKGAYYPSGPYPQPPLLEYYRTATGVKDRLVTLASSRYHWRACAPIFSSPALPVNATGFYRDVYADPVTGVSPYVLGGWSGGPTIENGPGVRGGTYCISCSGLTYPNFFTDVITAEIWMTRPGQSDVLLKSLSFPSKPYTDPKDVLSGTWSGVQMPTAHGACCATYMKFFSSGDPANITMESNSRYTLLPSTQVPWAHSVATGNLVAPGGLIAPFY